MAAAAHCSSSSALAPLTPIAPKRTPDLVLIGKPPANATRSFEKANPGITVLLIYLFHKLILQLV